MSGPASTSSIPPPPFQTPPKLQSVSEVMRDFPGTDVASLKRLAVGLARFAIFGRHKLTTKSLSGRNNIKVLEAEKLEYIKILIQSRVPEKSQVEFEFIWKECRTSLCKSCQTLKKQSKKNKLLTD